MSMGLTACTGQTLGGTVERGPVAERNNCDSSGEILYVFNKALNKKEM